MLIRTSQCRAVHVPLLLLVLTIPALPGAVFLLQQGIDLQSLGVSALALAMTAFALSRLRFISAREGYLHARSIFGGRTMDLERVALGTRVRHSQGHEYHTIYAHDGDQEIDLAEAGSTARAQKLKATLSSVLFPDGAERGHAGNAEEIVQAREARYQAKVAQAQQLAGASSGAMAYIVIGLVVAVAAILTVLVMANG